MRRYLSHRVGSTASRLYAIDATVSLSPRQLDGVEGTPSPRATRRRHDDEDAIELHGPVGVWHGKRSVTRHTRVRCMGRVYANTKRYLAMPRPYRVLGKEARCEACFFGVD